MQIVINLLIKPSGYREALEDYLKSDAFKKSPFLEWNNPKMDTGVVSERAFNRIFEIKDDQVCAKIINFEVAERVAYVTIEPYGPKADIINPGQMYTVAARLLKDGDVVKHIATFDLCAIENHIEYIGE